MLTYDEVEAIVEEVRERPRCGRGLEHTQMAAFNLLSKLTSSDDIVEWALNESIALSSPIKVNEETGENECNLTKEEMEFLACCGVFLEDDSFMMFI